MMNDENSYRDNQLTARSLQNLTRFSSDEFLPEVPTASQDIENSNEFLSNQSENLTFYNPDIFFWNGSVEVESYLKSESVDPLPCNPTPKETFPKEQMEAQAQESSSLDSVSISEENVSSEFGSRSAK